MKNPFKKEKVIDKEQEAEAKKEKAEVVGVVAGKEATKEEPHEATLDELIMSQPDIWYKTQVLALLMEINQRLKAFGEDDGTTPKK